MNKHPENRKSKGISVEGFWQRLKTEAGSKTGEAGSLGSAVLSADPHTTEAGAQGNTVSREAPAKHEDWVDRLDDWLDKLD